MLTGIWSLDRLLAPLERGIVMVTALPGHGKTLLLAEVAARWLAMGNNVVWVDRGLSNHEAEPLVSAFARSSSSLSHLHSNRFTICNTADIRQSCAGRHNSRIIFDNVDKYCSLNRRDFGDILGELRRANNDIFFSVSRRPSGSTESVTSHDRLPFYTGVHGVVTMCDLVVALQIHTDTISQDQNAPNSRPTFQMRVIKSREGLADQHLEIMHLDDPDGNRSASATFNTSPLRRFTVVPPPLTDEMTLALIEKNKADMLNKMILAAIEKTSVDMSMMIESDDVYL